MILIVADDAGEVSLLQTLFEAEVPVRTIQSAKEALELAQRFPLELVLLSYRESDAETYDLIQGLLDYHPNLTILLLCDERQIEKAAPLLDLKLVVPLSRPVNAQEIRDQIRRACPQLKERLLKERPAPPPESPPAPMDSFSMEELVRDLAHRLKNPLVVVRTFTHLLRERFNDPQFQKDFYQTMRQEVEKMDGLIDRLIEFSELPPPAMAPYALLPVLEEAAKQAKERLKMGRINLHPAIKDPEAAVWTDRDQLTYALTQLLVALGSTLSRNEALEVQIQGGAEPAGRLEVQMQTPGLKPRDQSLLIGLELFIGQRVTERLEGRMESQLPAEGPWRIGLFLPVAPFSADWSRLSRAGALPADTERRKRQMPIAFKDRRRNRSSSPFFPGEHHTPSATTP